MNSNQPFDALESREILISPESNQSDNTHPSLLLVRCPSCEKMLDRVAITELSERMHVYCNQCGEKIRYQQVFHLPSDQILSEHQKILNKLHESNTAESE